jgi:predicted NBD/HSP70 family sugar kinase
MSVYVGLDIGGTKFMAIAVDKNGNTVKKIKHSTPVSFKEGIDLLHNMVAEVANGNKILGIGAAIGGPLDPEKGMVSPLHQPEWRNIPLKQIMEEKWNCPFYVDVDTNVAALGEYHLGNYSEKTFLYMTISTGIGGGFLINGKIYHGLSHPEIGHQTFNFKCSHPENVTCECGVHDCLEALVSGNGIRRVYGKPAEKLNEEEWDEVAYNLGQALRNIATILSPEVIVLGGGVAVGMGERVFKKALKYMSDNAKLVNIPKVKLSHFGYETALMGSIYFAKGSHL